MSAFGCAACAMPAMAGFGVPGSDAVWNPYQGSPVANAEASYSFGQYGDYAQLPQPLPNAPGGALNLQQAGIFRAFGGYGYATPGGTGAVAAAASLALWWGTSTGKIRSRLLGYGAAAFAAIVAGRQFGFIPAWTGSGFRWPEPNPPPLIVAPPAGKEGSISER